jgi:hypothetical protein
MRKRADATVTVIPYYDFKGPGDYLTHLHRELGRVGVDADEMRDILGEPLREIARSLDDPMTEGMRMLYDYRALDYSVLLERMRQATKGSDNRRQLPKPRIAISIEVTTKDNLSVRWQPGHVSLRYFPIEAPEWAWQPSSEYAIGARPETELMFIRGFGRLNWGFEDPNHKAIAMLLVMATTSAVNHLVKRLKYHFDVQVLNRFKLTFAPAVEAGVSATKYAKEEVPVIWEIVHEIEELHARLKTLVEEFPERHGMTAEAFWTACDQSRFDLGHVDLAKASKHLRKEGKDHLTPKVVGGLFKDLDTAIEAGVWASPKPTPTMPETAIIPFRRP